MVSTKFKEYNVNSNDAINIIFVRHPNNMLESTLKFKPIMTHQMFDDENIYGYHSLKINLYIAAHSGFCFVDICYDDVLRGSKKFGLEPDNIMKHLMPWFPNNLLTDLNRFKDCLKKDEPDYIYGECIDCFMNINENKSLTGFRIINCDLSHAGFKQFHMRFQSLIIMFIDAANFIDLNDPSWRILYLYEECRVNGKKRYCPVGFCTMYLFKATTTVARISQFFIVPFLQRLGLGYKLLTATYNYLKSTIIDLEEITVESPNRIFTRLRDNLDASHLYKEPQFKKENLFKGFSDAMLKTARLKYKLSNDQARKVYEILRYYWAQDNEYEYEMFMLDVKQNRRTQCLKKPKQRGRSKFRAIEENKMNRALDHSVTLQEECDKFVGSIQLSFKFLQRNFGTRTSARTTLIHH